MTHESLAEFIKMLNHKDTRKAKVIATTKLTDTVNYVHAFGVGNLKQDVNQYYTIYNILGDCVAVVLDMGCGDLHLYTSEENRGKGYMVAAMNEAVIPHRKLLGHDYQQFHFENKETESWAASKLKHFNQPSWCIYMEDVNAEGLKVGKTELHRRRLFELFGKSSNALLGTWIQTCELLGEEGDALKEAVNVMDNAVYGLLK